jgi:large subunit ribosomal protein L31
MQENIHPPYSVITVECTCGNSFKVGSALGEDLHIEVCNNCHTFHTGTQRIIGSSGRVEGFNRRFGITKEAKE